MATLLFYYLIMFISVFFMFFVTKKKHKNEKLTDHKINIVFFSLALFIDNFIWKKLFIFLWNAWFYNFILFL